MDKRGWSRSDLARYADLNRAVINKLLNGKSHPQPSTLESISRALKMPLETTYRAAGLLPAAVDNDDAMEAAMHVFKSIQSTQRRATALALLKALIIEEGDMERSAALEKSASSQDKEDELQKKIVVRDTSRFDRSN